MDRTTRRRGLRALADCGSGAGRIVLALSFLATAGCTTDQAHLRLVSTHGSGLGRALAEHRQLPLKRGIVGQDTAVTSILFFPTGWRPRLGEALKDAERRARGGSATAARVQSRNWWFFVSVSSLRVIADVAQIEPDPSVTGQREFAVLSNEWVRPLYGVDAAGARVADVEGTDRLQHFLWVPTHPNPPTLEHALDRAIASGRGDVLVDADVEYSWWTIPLIYGRESWHVRGDALRTPWVRVGRAVRHPASLEIGP
jgi:hypothetical protein